MPRYISYYLNTQSATSLPSAPFDKTTLARCKWVIRWQDVFRNCTALLENPLAKMRVRVQLISTGSASLTWAANKGTLRLNGLGSVSQNMENGIILGTVQPIAVPAGGSYYLQCDTTQSVGQEVSFPSLSELCLCFVNDIGGTMVNVPEYECTLHFEIEEQADQVPAEEKSIKKIVFAKGGNMYSRSIVG